MDETEARQRIERMVAWNVAPMILSVAEVDDLVQIAKVRDVHGVYPFTDEVDEDGALVPTEGWTPTWDLRAAAREGWTWKASRIAGRTNFSADGVSYNVGDLLDHCERMVKSYGRKGGMIYTGRSRRHGLDQVTIVGNQ